MNKVLADILDRPVPKGLSILKVQTLIKEVAMLDTNSKLVYSASGERIIKELDKYGVKDIPQNYRGVLLEHWLELLSQNQETFTEVPRPTGPDATTLTSDQLIDLGESAEKRAQQKATIQAREKEAVAKFKETGEKRYQDQQRQEALKEKQTQELLNQFFKKVGGKVVVVPVGEIPEVQLTKENKEILLATEIAAKEDPATTQKVFEEKIQLALNNSELEYKESVKEEGIKKSAAHLVETLRNLPDHKSIDEIPDNPKTLNTLSIINPLSNPDSPEMVAMIPDKESREEFAKKVQALMLTSEAESVVNFAGASAIFGEDGENLIYSLYGPDTITDFKISSDENDRDQGVEIDPQAVYEKGRQVYDFINKVRQAKTTEEVTSTALAYYPTYTYSGVTTATKTVSTLTKALPAVGAVYGFRQGTLLAHWARYNTPLLISGGAVPFLTAGGIQNTVLMSNGLSSKILFTKNFATGYSVQVMQFTKGTNTLYTAGATFGNKAFGVYLGQAGGKVGAGTIAVKTTGQVAVKALPAAIASKIGAFLGSAGGLVGVAVGFIGGELIGKLIEKINWPKVKKWFQENGPVLAGVAGLGGLALGGPAVGGLVLFGGLAATGSLSAFATGAFGVLGLIGRSVGIAIATPVIVTLLVLPPLVAFIMLVINNSAYVVPPSPPSSESGLGSEGLPGVACTEVKLPTSITFSVDSPIATRAWEIVEDLYQGFWCYWNRSPGDLDTDVTTYPDSYPELFDMDEYIRNPNPSRGAASSCGECMFWCTWLVQKSYKESGYDLLYTLWSPTMYDDFNKRDKILNERDLTKDNIQMGAVIFFDVKNSEDRIDHVAVVYSVSSAGVKFVQSNSGTKDDFIPFGTDGILQNPSYATIKGVGNP